LCYNIEACKKKIMPKRTFFEDFHSVANKRAIPSGNVLEYPNRYYRNKARELLTHDLIQALKTTMLEYATIGYQHTIRIMYVEPPVNGELISKHDLMMVLGNHDKSVTVSRVLLKNFPCNDAFEVKYFASELCNRLQVIIGKEFNFTADIRLLTDRFYEEVSSPSGDNLYFVDVYATCIGKCKK